MNIKHKKGFGILEVLLAGIVIVIVLGSLVFLARNTLNSSIYLSQKAQATFLAQEGIEIVRNIRDSNYIDSNNKTQWDTLLIDNSGDAKQYVGNAIYGTTSKKANGAERPEGLFRLSNAKDQLTLDNVEYSRKIVIENQLNQLLDGDSQMQDNAFMVTSTVTWQSPFRDGEIIISELITNSRQGL